MQFQFPHLGRIDQFLMLKTINPLGWASVAMATRITSLDQKHLFSCLYWLAGSHTQQTVISKSDRGRLTSIGIRRPGTLLGYEVAPEVPFVS